MKADKLNRPQHTFTAEEYWKTLVEVHLNLIHVMVERLGRKIKVKD
jgi:hypothetical protein